MIGCIVQVRVKFYYIYTDLIVVAINIVPVLLSVVVFIVGNGTVVAFDSHGLRRDVAEALGFKPKGGRIGAVIHATRRYFALWVGCGGVEELMGEKGDAVGDV